MSVGRQIVAPEGWGPISKNDYVYFLSRSELSVNLVLFYEGSNEWRTKLISLNPLVVEEALTQGYLILESDNKTLPPWFPSGKSTHWAYQRMQAIPKSQERAFERLNAIRPAYESANSWKDNDNPEKIINIYAKEARYNTARYRLYLFTYIIFGPELQVLQPKNWNCGIYDRMSAKNALGRRSLNGARFGKKLRIEDKDVFAQGYKKLKKERLPISEMFVQILIKYFSVKKNDITIHKNGNKKIVRKDGVAVPSIYQFRYWANNNIGKDQIYRDRFGKEKERNKRNKIKGHYSEECVNLMDSVERDAYVAKEIPIGIDSQQLHKIHVVHLVDRLSSAIVGIGFSHGGEKAEAYRMAEFCAAIDKTTFCRLMGVEEFDPDNWPCIGTSANTITDRGPGASENVQSVFAELAPSHSPQSKPLVESSNPKKDSVSGPTTHVSTTLKPLELMRNAIRYAIDYNNTRNIIEKIPNRFIEKKIQVTPIGLWVEMDKCLRNSAIIISFEEAVRRYLNKGFATETPSGLRFRRQRYYCPALQDATLVNRSGSSVVVYYMPMNLRQIWVETSVGLLELGAIMGFQDVDDQLDITYHELSSYEKIKNQLESEHRDHKVAMRVVTNLDASSETGQGMHPGRITKGRQKNKTPESRRDMKRLRGEE
jgi:hypothetical protein